MGVSVLPAPCGDVQPISVCSMSKRRAESAGAGAHAGAKRRVVSAGAGLSLTGTEASGGGGVALAAAEQAAALVGWVNMKAASAKKIAVSRATQDAVGIAPVKKDTNAARR